MAPADPNDPPKMVAAGKADIAVTYQPQLHMQVDHGLPLVRIAHADRDPAELPDGARRPDRSTRSPTSKAARSATRSAASRTRCSPRCWPSTASSSMTCKLVNVNFALAPALVSGQVDAVIGAFRNFEVNQLKSNNTPARVFYPEERRRAALRRADPGRQPQPPARPPAEPLPRCAGSRRAVSGQPPEGQLEAVHQGSSRISTTSSTGAPGTTPCGASPCAPPHSTGRVTNTSPTFSSDVAWSSRCHHWRNTRWNYLTDAGDEHGRDIAPITRLLPQGIGSAALVNRHVVALGVTGIDLAWPVDPATRRGALFTPVGDPARQPADGEHHREHLRRNAHARGMMMPL